MKLLLRVLAALLLVAVVAVVGAAVFFEDLVIWGFSPTVAFDPAALPPPPDYADLATWSALPEREDAADAAVDALPAGDQRLASVDAFYVHPTSYIGTGWNGPVDDPVLNADTDRVATRIQAGAFNACCAVYAPRYRQANGMAFTKPTPDGRRAIDVAYQDVRAAFHAFLGRRAPARPFVLAAHSQGSALLRRLLKEEISGTPLRDTLVVAYVIGTSLTERGLTNEAPDIPVCASATQTGCVVAWNARAPGFVSGRLEFHVEGDDLGDRICVNPLTWRHDELPADATQNAGAVFLDANPPVMIPQFASARCSGGALVVDEIGEAPRDFMSKLLDHALGAGNYHPIEYQVFFADLRANASARSAAWVEARRAVVEPTPGG